MEGLLRYLRNHPLVWIIPLIFLVLVLGTLAWKLSQTPDSPFIYDV